MLENLKLLFRRDLEKVKLEIEQYKAEEKIWVVEKSIANSAGNLCLHLVGNLNTYIGAQLGHTGYVRHRDLEFSLKDVARGELIEKAENTIQVVTKTLGALKESQLDEIHPFLIFEEKTTVEFLLLHLTTHLAYHLGQINYHRRLLDKI